MGYEARFAHPKPRSPRSSPSSTASSDRRAKHHPVAADLDHEICRGPEWASHVDASPAPTAPRQIRQRPRSLTARIAANRARTTLPLAMGRPSRKRVRERGQTPVGERQVASVAALPMSSRSLTVSPRARGDHRVAEGRAVSPFASPPRRGSVRLWRSGCLSTLPLCAGWRM